MIKTPILILLAVGIFVALITSGVCNGPIDEVFIGWRDTTACESGIWTCFVGESSSSERDLGGRFLVFISIISILVFGLYKAFSWFKNR
jgi:hypothetical protein